MERHPLLVSLLGVLALAAISLISPASRYAHENNLNTQIPTPALKRTLVAAETAPTQPKSDGFDLADESAHTKAPTDNPAPTQDQNTNASPLSEITSTLGDILGVISAGTESQRLQAVEPRVAELQRQRRVGQQCGGRTLDFRPPTLGPMFVAGSCGECEAKCNCIGEGDPWQCEVHPICWDTAYLWNSLPGELAGHGLGGCGCGRPEFPLHPIGERPPVLGKCKQPDPTRPDYDCGGTFYYTYCAGSACVVNQCPSPFDPYTCPRNECTLNTDCDPFAVLICA